MGYNFHEFWDLCKIYNNNGSHLGVGPEEGEAYSRAHTQSLIPAPPQYARVIVWVLDYQWPNQPQHFVFII